MDQKSVLPLDQKSESPTTWQSSVWTNPHKQSFFDEASAKAKPYLTQMINHPFFQELIKGTLDIKKNQFYTAQLVFYLAAISRSLAFLAGRSENQEEFKSFWEFATYVSVLQTNWANFYPGQSLPASFTCQAYNSYLLSTATLAEVASATAALLPSCWMHFELMKYISQQHPGPHNPYKAWIDTFLSKGFSEVTQKAIAVTNQMAEKVSQGEKTLMLDYFLKSSQMEYTLLNTSYHLQLQQGVQQNSQSPSLQLVAKF